MNDSPHPDQLPASDEGNALNSARMRRWQAITLATLFTGYVGYYICRANLSVATPLLLEEFGAQGAGQIDKEDIGWVASVGVALYAVGKITNGVSADFFGGRVLFLLGIFASVACCVLFGMASGLAAFVALWAVNRYVQSMGWVSLVKTASRWYPAARHATVMGVLSMSFLLGDAFARIYLGACIDYGAGWRQVFFISAVSFAAIGLICLLALRGSPRDVGLPEPPANVANVYGGLGENASPNNLWRLVAPLLASVEFWLIAVMNFGLTLIRETFNFWTPTYLYEVAGLDAGKAAMLSMLFPLVGAASALAAGIISDYSGGRHGRVILPSLVLLAGVLAWMGVADVQGRPVYAVILVCCAAFFLIGPYSFLSGVVALDIGGKRGSATTAGLSDSAGYAGGILSGVWVARIASNGSWSAVLLMLSGVAILTTLAAIGYLIHQERKKQAILRRG